MGDTIFVFTLQCLLNTTKTFLAFIKPVAKNQFLNVEHKGCWAVGLCWPGNHQIRACADRCLSVTQKSLLSASEHSQFVEGLRLLLTQNYCHPLDNCSFNGQE